MKKLSLLVLVLFSSLSLSGCLGDLIGMSCDFLEDSDHCYQSAAVQESEEEKCAKITGEGFSGSNPPRDKCYLQIAENTGNVEICDKIEGGFMSYSKEDCIKSVNAKNGVKEEVDPADITADKLKELTEELENAKAEAGSNPDDPEAKKKLADLQAKEREWFDKAPESVRNEYFKNAREEMMEGMDDDVKSSIAKIFTEFRDQNPNTSLNDQIKKMQEIKENQDTIKRLDEQANTLMDQLKETASEFANDTIDDLVGDDVKKYQAAMEAKARKLAEEYGGEKLTAGIAQLEALKEKYDKASEQFEKINEQVEKLKKVYEEVTEVTNKVNEINKLVGEGKLDVDRAKVLHGAVYLGKGLEYATSYVPVFGSTISTISKETMDATLKFATSRAQRTTALDKCIEDPENCDPTGITPY